MNDFIAERPKEIFIDKKNIKKGNGKNVYVDENKKRVYEYNNNYYSYKEQKLNERCKIISEDIDKETKRYNKPLLISTKEYNEEILKIYEEYEKDNEKYEIKEENEEINLINERNEINLIIHN